MFGVEGGHMIEDDLNKLETLYNRGARYLTLTHNIAPSGATSAADETPKHGRPKSDSPLCGRPCLVVSSAALVAQDGEMLCVKVK